MKSLLKSIKPTTAFVISELVVVGGVYVAVMVKFAARCEKHMKTLEAQDREFKRAILESYKRSNNYDY